LPRAEGPQHADLANAGLAGDEDRVAAQDDVAQTRAQRLERRVTLDQFHRGGVLWRRWRGRDLSSVQGVDDTMLRDRPVE